MFIINDVEWKVIAVPPDHSTLYRSDGTVSLAACDNNDKAIYINNSLNEKKLRKVICHEITHAAMFSYNVTLTLDQEELLADIIATYGEEIIEITNKVFKKIRKGASD